MNLFCIVRIQKGNITQYILTSPRHPKQPSFRQTSKHVQNIQKQQNIHFKPSDRCQSVQKGIQDLMRMFSCFCILCLCFQCYNFIIFFHIIESVIDNIINKIPYREKQYSSRLYHLWSLGLISDASKTVCYTTVCDKFIISKQIIRQMITK